MLNFHDVHLPGPGKRSTFNGLSFQLGLRRAIVLAERDELTSAFVNLVIGARKTPSGSVKLIGRPSWPIGQSIIVQSSLTGRETIRFFSDLYNLEYRACVQDATRWFGAPLLARRMNTWTSAERIKFERLAALWPDFDIFIVHGAGLTGDAEFDAEWLTRFQEKLVGRGLLAVVPPMEPWSWMCDITVLLRSNEIICFHDLADALLAAKPAETGELIEEPTRPEPSDDEIF